MNKKENIDPLSRELTESLDILRANSDMTDTQVSNILKIPHSTLNRYLNHLKNFYDVIALHEIFEIYGGSMEDCFESGKKRNAYIKSLEKELEEVEKQLEKTNILLAEKDLLLEQKTQAIMELEKKMEHLKKHLDQKDSTIQKLLDTILENSKQK